ncbi:MAG: TolC family protein [Candidatus Cryptobacteroides sp.]
MSVLSSAEAQAQSTVRLSLEQCKAMSGENDADLKNAALDVSSARFLKKEALTEYFPNVSMSGIGFYAFKPILNIGLQDVLGTSDGAQNIIDGIEAAAPLYGISTTASFLDYGYNASVSLTQPVFAGGRIVNGNRLADLNYQASLLKQSSASKAKGVEVEEKYWKVVSLEEKMLSLTKALELVDTLGKDVRNACRAGLALDTDTLKVNIERNSLRSSMRQLQSGIRLAKMDLFNAIGQEYSFFPPSADGSSSTPWIDEIELSDTPSELLPPEYYYVDEVSAASASEESRLLSMNVESSKLQKKMALGEALPEVGVGAGYGYGRLVGDSGRWNGAVYAVVKIPLTDHWKSSSKVNRMQNEVRKAENQKEYLDEQLVLQLRKLYEELTCAYEKIGIASDKVALCEISESRTLNLYRSGQATLSDVLAAQTEMRQAEDGLTDARIEYAVALSAYLSKSR